MALRFSGRFMMTQAMRSFFSTRTVSNFFTTAFDDLRAAGLFLVAARVAMVQSSLFMPLSVCTENFVPFLARRIKHYP